MFWQQRSRKYFARSIQAERKIRSWIASGFRRNGVSAPRERNDLDVLRARRKEAERRVAESERLVAGWRDIVVSEQAAGHDVAVARDLLKGFQTGLEVAMRDKQEAERALTQRLLDIFEGVRGRLPQNDHELHEWLASPEGKAATAFEPTPPFPWRERGRS